MSRESFAINFSIQLCKSIDLLKSEANLISLIYLVRGPLRKQELQKNPAEQSAGFLLSYPQHFN